MAGSAPKEVIEQRLAETLLVEPISTNAEADIAASTLLYEPRLSTANTAQMMRLSHPLTFNAFGLDTSMGIAMSNA